MKIAIIDYGMGNLFSVLKALESLGADAVVTDDKTAIRRADKLVLPGVGAFGDCMYNLRQSGVLPAIYDSVANGKPLLGICLGLQVLFDGSEEDPAVEGLGLLPGTVRKIKAPGLKVPHMGWNSLQFARPSGLFSDLPADPHVYFVHSYHAEPADSGVVTAYADYGGQVTAAVQSGNIFATQFHPEKSGKIGLMILNNFIRQR